MGYYERNLPHWHPPDTQLFLTWRLAGSLPSKCDWMSPSRNYKEGHKFAIMDRELERCAYGPVWLQEARIAQMVLDTLHHGEQDRDFYRLRAYVVMPNHVHLLLQPLTTVSVITRWLKGSTARRANQLLCRTGRPFWQDESYDHWVRDNSELQKIVRHIEQNPVRAGLASSPGAWPWSSAATTGESACST